MDIQSDNLVDLISEKYSKLRRIHDIKWSNSSELPISNSEGLIISLIHKNGATVSEIAQQAQISRQAAHKNIKALIAKDIIYARTAEDNNRKKILNLTPLGEECLSKNKLIKVEIENSLIGNLSEEDVLQFKKTLKKMNWDNNE